jgi:hypothetical protein
MRDEEAPLVPKLEFSEREKREKNDLIHLLSLILFPPPLFAVVACGYIYEVVDAFYRLAFFFQDGVTCGS